MRIKLLFIFGILCFNAKAQEVTTIIPPSPEAAALGKFTEIPVGLHTGVPNINIPLNTISSGKLSLDLSLTYHSTIKVQDEASSVGLGWSLSGIGLISRSVIGLADDLPGGYFSVLNRIDKYINDELTDEEKLDYLKSVDRGLIDSQPDQYFFNIGGYSGKIVLDKAGQPYVIPHQNLKILPGIGPMQTDPINPWWEIITPDGTRYKFDHQAVEQTTPTSQGIVPDPVGSDRFISSWRLSEIISSDHVDTIKFGYFPTITNNFSQYVTKKTLADPRIIPNCSFSERNTFNQTGSLIVGKLVSGIIHRHGKIDFIYSSREDLPGSGKLDSVIVYDHNDQIKMSYVFEYDYFNSSVTSETEPHLCKRLKLLSVREINNGLEKPPYEFIYNEQNQLPPKAALKEGTQEEKNAWMSQDHWGFFNGRQNNSLIPRTVIEYWIGQSAFELVIPGGNRSSNVGSSLSISNVIKEIKYPTGGASTFTFEGHEVFEGQEQGWVPFQNASVAGGIGELPPLLGPCVYPLDDAGTDYPKFACSDLFEVQEGGESFKMIINHYYGGQFPLQGTSVMSTRILNENGSVVRRYDGENLSFDLIIRLDPGKYRLMAASSVVDAGTSISLRKSGGTIHTNVPKGGARIAKIVDFDGFNPEKKMVREFSYKSRINPGKSSGILFTTPIYQYENNSSFWDEDGGTVFCGYLNLFANSVNELGRSQGSHVGYDEVTVKYGDNGSSTSRFNTINDVEFNSFPFAPSTSYSWQRGTLEEKLDFNADGELVRREEYHYTFEDERIKNIVTGFKTGIKENFFSPVLRDYIVQIYNYISAWTHLDFSIVTYFNQGNSIVNETENIYNNPVHLLVTEQLVKSSKGDTIKTNIRYPADYSNPTEPLAKMLEKHIHTPVVEEIQIRNNKVISARATNYIYDNQLDVILPNAINQLETNSPLTDFSYSSNGSIFDGRYTQLTGFEKFDDNGNILEMRQRDGLSTSFVWGYNMRYPIAKIDNATHNANGDLVDNQGNVFTKAKIDELTVFSGTTEQFTVKFEGLRDALPDAFISTYTYNPLVGMTSQTDPNGTTTYYEYDDLGRLKLIRDHEDNILQHYEYYYHDAGQ